ncbi:hypothetical protein Moror_2077 [Moniliophthora roreri MCA 2997]|uniref:DUF6593 domain-containing protein n=2 Tax=Moniliophthora roreri TaxID=221103 RepID=V2XWI4_MONRO|nr:hypothetical protein Moror_2077 [Moniliophthora roreri MCA 2997]KAI3621513.1 hypothetical protein WG66_017022 [Moniliophthora roreri]
MASPSTESFSTLLDPEYQVTGATRLVFDRNNIRNTSISIRSSPAYTLKTTTGTLGSKTEIIDAITDQSIASIERRELLPNIVKLKSVEDGKSMKLSKWLRKVKLPDGSHGTVVNTLPQGQFIWKTDPVHRLVLYPEGSTMPVARLERATTSTPLALLVFPGAMQYADQIITSFLAVEQELRMQEFSMKRRADASLFEASNVFGGGSY